MRILINAFGFSPYRGSECAVGWNIAHELAKMHDVTVITGNVCGGENDWPRYLEEHGQVQNLCVEYVEPTRIIALFEKMHRLPGCWGLYYLAYNLWQRQAFRRAKQLCKVKKFDIVHQLNMIGYREPGYMWKLGIPFVWGPVGGAPNEPIAYHSLFSWSGCVKVFLRTACNEIQKRICWRARRAAKCAKKIWAVTDDDYNMIKNIWGVECEKMVETGTVLRNEGFVRSWDGKFPLRIVWSGIHTSRKALPILILALEKIFNQSEKLKDKIIVDILGEGPETKNWKRLAKKTGVTDQLIWHGKLSHEEALKVMNTGHIFAFPSLKEGTPHVVLESLSLGMPVICHNACGMGTVVKDCCGMKIPLKSPEESVTGFADAISEVINYRIDLSTLSQGALRRTEELTWHEKAKKIGLAYNDVISEK